MSAGASKQPISRHIADCKSDLADFFRAHLQEQGGIGSRDPAYAIAEIIVGHRVAVGDIIKANKLAI